MPTMSSSRVKPVETPCTALAARARVSPCSALYLSLSRTTSRRPSACLKCTPPGIGTVKAPLGPVRVSELVHMTHFSSTRDMTSTVMAQQIARFVACHEVNPKAQVSVSNSAVLIAKPALRTDWVRPGIMLYGENPLGDQQPLPLRAVMTLRARIIAVREIAIGESVGYDGCWTSQRPSR